MGSTGTCAVVPCMFMIVYGYYQLVLSFDLFLVLLCDCYKLSQGSGSPEHFTCATGISRVSSQYICQEGSSTFRVK